METKQEPSSEEAQKALAAVDENSAASESVKEPTVPLHDHTALRSKLQDERVERARLQGKLDALATSQATEAPAVLSPIDAEIARQMKENTDLTEDDINFSAKIWREQRLYESQVANQAEQAAAAQTHLVSQQTSAAAIRLVHDDYDKIIHDGENLLTKYQKAEVLDAGMNFGEVSYAMCKKAIEASKPAPKSSEPTEEEKTATAAAVKKKVDTDAANKTVLSQDEILKNASPAAAAAFNL